MINDKFKLEEQNLSISDIDWTNLFYDFKQIFEDDDAAVFISDTEVSYPNPQNLNEDHKTPTFILAESGMVKVNKPNAFKFAVGKYVTKFMLLCTIKFDGNIGAAESFIAYKVREKNLPYIRVGTDYLRVINKKNRFGGESTMLKSWKKETITDDHGKMILQAIPKYDDFCIVPDNVNHKYATDRCFNLYSPFPHKPYREHVELDEIPNTKTLVSHIFGEQVDLGMKYLKILYERPTQILPVLCMVSEERETGKTTFLNWMIMMFGENAVHISPQTLTSNYNDSYATKNIIIIDETVVEKSTSIEKLKSLATAKTLAVSQKFISHYSVPFFGKIIIATNKEQDFMRIDESEIRFWIRKVPQIEGEKNTNIENDLFAEIPKFLKYLTQLPDVDLSKTRMVFTAEEIGTKELLTIKDESKSWLRKELEMFLEDYFNNNCEKPFFEATPKDIKEKWFMSNNQVTMSYIRKVLKYEMKLNSEEPKRYNPFDGVENQLSLPLGRPYIFNNPSWTSKGDSPANVSGGRWWDSGDKNSDDLPF